MSMKTVSYEICGISVDEETFKQECRKAGVDGFPKAEIRRKNPHLPFDDGRRERVIDPGPWKSFRTDTREGRFCNVDNKLFVEHWEILK